MILTAQLRPPGTCVHRRTCEKRPRPSVSASEYDFSKTDCCTYSGTSGGGLPCGFCGAGAAAATGGFDGDGAGAGLGAGLAGGGSDTSTGGFGASWNCT